MRSRLGEPVTRLKSRFLPVPMRIKRFARVHGYTPNLKSPRSFSEKLLYRILYEDDPLYVLYGCKFVAPYYARALAGSDLKFAKRYAVYKGWTGTASPIFHRLLSSKEVSDQA